MTGNATTFEVLVEDRTGWTVVGVFENQDDATAEAEAQCPGGRGTSVKVTRVGYNEATGEFKEHDILFLGERNRKTTNDVGPADGGPLCQSVNQLYGVAARAAIRRLLRDYLNRTDTTVMELLYHPDLMQRLENTGSLLMGAIQRAAMAQVRGTEMSVQQRTRDLYKLAEELRNTIRKHWRDGEIVRMQDRDVAALRIAISDRKNREFLFSTAVVIEMQAERTFAGKFEYLLALIAETPADNFSLPLLDTLLSDLLSNAATLTALLGDQPNLGQALLLIADLALGGVEMTDCPAPIRMLNDLIGQDRLPSCRDALLDRLVLSLRGSRFLTDGGAVDEILFNADLAKRIRRDDGSYLGSAELEKAFKSRSERYLGPDMIGQLLQGVVDPLARVTCLMNIEHGIVGKMNKRKLVSYILPIFADVAGTDAFIQHIGPPENRMRQFAAVQARVLESGFSNRQKEEISEQLDYYCMQLINDRDIFGELDRADKNCYEKATTVLRMCTENVFTEGIASRVAHDQALRYIRDPAFMQLFLQESDSKEEKRRRLESLERLIARLAKSAGRVRADGG